MYEKRRPRIYFLLAKISNTLEHFIGREVDSRDDVRWAEGALFHFGEVVPWVSVQDHFPDRDQREVFVRPDLNLFHNLFPYRYFGDIEWVELEFLGLIERHHLDL